MQDESAKEDLAARVTRALLFAKSRLQRPLLRFQLSETLFDGPACHVALNGVGRHLPVPGEHMRNSALSENNAARLICGCDRREKSNDVRNCTCCLATSRGFSLIDFDVAERHFGCAICNAELS
jgi:hypothetical protein